MTRYLVTDPCYIVPRDEWSKFCDDRLYEMDEHDTPYEIKGLGRIIKCAPSEGGDGHWKLGNGKEVMTDAGTVCLVELEEGAVPTEYQGNAVTKTRGVAEHWFSQVVGHECF